MKKPALIKIGGHHIEDASFLAELAAVVRNFPVPVVIVHGGGAEISTMQKLMAIEPRYVDGLRITDEKSLAMVEMVLCGVVNKRLVRYLVHAGVEALGLSGVDQGMIRATRMQHPLEDMGFTGTITSVRADVLNDLIDRGITPVIAPVCIGEHSNLNVNADHVAGAVAVAIEASRVIFITNVPGVLTDGVCVERLSVVETRQLIENGVISGGMIPKVRTALETLESGVPQVSVTDLDGLKTHGGTLFVRDHLPHAVRIADP